jgi:hypothetical protein
VFDVEKHTAAATIRPIMLGSRLTWRSALNVISRTTLPVRRGLAAN